jgi:uncharacterized protein YyaL (SSP411 family)
MDIDINFNQNNLAQSGSPYLRQHAKNPVHWQEWNSDVLDEAKRLNKPLLVSIGYAACHWCHVMARESFMDEKVAAYMNEHFMCIKIDREERPDLDQIFMEASQMINRSGGWPLNAFALPDGRPFHAGTYYPTHNWMQLLQQIKDLYKSRYNDVLKQAEILTDGISSHNITPVAGLKSETNDLNLFNGYSTNLKKYLDREGGLSGAPKFPMPVVWENLLLHYYLDHDITSLTAVTSALKAMMYGGIFDQVGGGFARYTVDANWKIPHFEKMLYDNGQLVSLYAHALQLTGNDMYRRVIDLTLKFVSRELMDSSGGFYSSLNADSEGEEGKFYTWNYDELKEILSDEEFNLTVRFCDIKKEGNWEDGKNIIHFDSSKAETLLRMDNPDDEQFEHIESALKKLFEVREKRIRPTTDKKHIVSWNAIMLKGFIDAFRATGNSEYLATARKNAIFLKEKAVSGDGSVIHSFIDNAKPVQGFLEDYAFLASAFSAMYEVTFEKIWLDIAGKILHYSLNHFYDTETALFYFTSEGTDNSIARKHEITDHVIPSSNSELGIAFLKAGTLLDDEKLLTAGRNMASHIPTFLGADTYYYSNWAIFSALHSHGLNEVAIMGEHALNSAKKMMKKYHPDYLYAGGAYENLPVLENRYQKGKTVFYVCRNKACDLPVETPEEALEIMLREFGE